MKIAGGIAEKGIIIGNTYDKYGSANPIVRKIMEGFSKSLSHLIDEAKPKTIHEIGCGEGYWVRHWNSQGIITRGSDFSEKVISLARENSKETELPSNAFSVRSIYDLEKDQDSADTLVCCEVLEHLENPAAGLSALRKVATNYVILNVPREPIWRILNMIREKYWGQLGNTPGHLNHWSSGSFIQLVGQYFDIVKVHRPLPWTMLLCKVKK